jgi:hypothetical protein
MLTVATGVNTDVTVKKTYIYKINFQCLADSIEEADACFAKEAQLTYGKKNKPGHECPLITVEVVAPPKDGYSVSVIERKLV